MVLVIPIISLKNRFMFILFLYSNVVKSYKEVKIKEPVYPNNPFLHFYNKW